MASGRSLATALQTYIANPDEVSEHLRAQLAAEEVRVVPAWPEARCRGLRAAEDRDLPAKHGDR